MADFNYFKPIKQGSFSTITHWAGTLGQAFPGSMNASRDVIYTAPLILTQMRVIDNFLFNVGTVVAGSYGNVKIAVYGPVSNRDLYPNSLLFDAGSYPLEQLVNFCPTCFQVGPGFYWLCCLLDTDNPTSASDGSGKTGWAVLGWDSDFITGRAGWSKPSLYDDGFTDPFPNGASAARFVPTVGVTFSA